MEKLCRNFAKPKILQKSPKYVTEKALQGSDNTDNFRGPCEIMNSNIEVVKLIIWRLYSNDNLFINSTSFPFSVFYMIYLFAEM